MNNNVTLRNIFDSAVSTFLSGCNNQIIGLQQSFEQDLIWIFQHVLGVDRAKIIIDFDLTLDNEKTNIIQAMVDRRLFGEPLQYILQHVQFGGLELFVDRRVLIPRDDTEQWCIWAEQKIRVASSNANFNALDLCTGSGAIALFFARRFQMASFVGSDISEQALEVARKNMQANAIENVEFVQGDLFEAAAEGQKFDIIFSNPPYIAPNLYDALDRQVKDFEPKNALVAGLDGLEFYARIFRSAPQFLTSKNGFGWVFLEYDQYTYSGVDALARENGFQLVECFVDMANKPRAGLYKIAKT